MNTFIFGLACLLAVAWWISGEVRRLKHNKQVELEDELALAKMLGVLDE